ncbi:MAG: thioredoxin family protein [Sulfurospirillaceae bacterium]|nr:thioredoxin family protein [Sulfurospirillaceae bacterium]MDD2827699.1 thioredoxin family protein [Sulfurospirillaceae bacterium]
MRFFVNLGVALLFLASLCHANEESFEKQYHYFTSYKEAHAKAVETHKPLMILFVTTSCPWCQKLESQTLKKESVNAYVQAHFIPVFLNKDIDSFPKSLLPVVSPTIFFVEPKEEKQFYDILGYKSAVEFLELIQEANETFMKMHP